MPAPSGKPVLAVDRGLGSKADDGDLRLDLQTLERLGVIRYSVEDPWLKRNVTYSGVLLSGLVEGIDELEYKDLWIWNIKSITFQ